MEKEDFRKKRIKRRQQLLDKIVETFKSLNPIAIHVFGSGARKFKDEFSDIDIWITFKDSEIENILKKLNSIFKTVSPVLIRHHSRSWSPVGGSSNSVIHNTEDGPIVVDYYISKLSKTIIKKDSKVLYGDDSLKRGEWLLNKDVNNRIRDSHTLRKDLNLLIDLIFIGIKGIVRKWEDDIYINNLKTVHKKFRERYDGNIPMRRINLSFRSNFRLLNDLHRISSKSQRQAIFKIKKFMKHVEELY